jgi:hypothetical protein
MKHLKFTPAQDNWLEVTWIDNGKEIKHTSYHPTQLNLLYADAETMDTSLNSYEDMLFAWVASYVPPAPLLTPVPQQITRAQGKAALITMGV